MNEILECREAVRSATERLEKLQDKHESLKARISEAEAELANLKQADDLDVDGVAECGGRLASLKTVEPDILDRIQHVREELSACSRELGHSLSRSLHQRRDETKKLMAEHFDAALNVLDAYEDHCEATFRAHHVKGVRPHIAPEDDLFASVRVWIKSGHSRRVSAIMKQAVR